MMDSGSAVTRDQGHAAVADSAPRANNVSRLPADIYLEILDIMKPCVAVHIVEVKVNPARLEFRPMETYKRDLSNLALTSRSFRNICQQRLFEYIHFVDPTNSNERRESFTRTEFCREIASGNQSARTLASYVKKCQLTCSDTPGYIPPDQSAQDLLTSRIQAVACMINLETLFLYYTPVTRELLGVIRSLKSLKTCLFQYSNFSLVLPGDIRPDLFSSTLTSFILLAPYSSDALEKPLLGAIPASLKFLRINSQGFTGELINNSRLYGLVELELFGYNVTQLGQFLNHLHSLRRLALESRDHSHMNLSPSALPLLTHVACSAHLALELVTGRPVKSLTLISDSQLLSMEAYAVEAYTALKYSTAKDQSFKAMSPDVMKFQSLPSIDLPHLTKLWVGISIPEDDLEIVLRAIYRIWKHSLSLHSLHIQNLIDSDGGPYNLSLQHRVISQTIKSLPALTTIAFMNEVEWQYTGSGNFWKPVIREYGRDGLKWYIMKYGKAGETVDLEGCYAGLFTKDELNDVLPKLQAS